MSEIKSLLVVCFRKIRSIENLSNVECNLSLENSTIVFYTRLLDTIEIIIRGGTAGNDCGIVSGLLYFRDCNFVVSIRENWVFEVTRYF